jgi:hypothetical protein
MMSRISPVVAVLAMTIALGVSAAELKVKNSKARIQDGDIVEWVSELRGLQKLLPDDRGWIESINGFVLSHRGEAVDLCGALSLITCNTQHQIESVTIDQPVGRVVWSALPASVHFVTFTNGKFTQRFSARSIPSQLQAVKFYGCNFHVDPSSIDQHSDDGLHKLDSSVVAASDEPSASAGRQLLHELVLWNAQITELDWALPPSLVYLDLSQNQLPSINFAALPDSIRFLNLTSSLAATADALNPWGRLPKSLVSLDISNLKVTPITKMPEKLEELHIRGNNLATIPDLSSVAATLRRLDLSNNELSGALPNLATFVKLRDVDVSNNKLTTFDFSALSPKLGVLRASHNQITGTIDLTALPASLVVLELGFNSMTGALDLTKLPVGMETLDLQSNKFSGPIDFSQFPQSIRYVYVQKNQLSGRPNLSKLPVDLRRILFGDNAWASLMPR